MELSYEPLDLYGTYDVVEAGDTVEMVVYRKGEEITPLDSTRLRLPSS